MKKKEKHKQHEQTGEELFPRLIQQSRKSVVPRWGKEPEVLQGLEPINLSITVVLVNSVLLV